MNKKLITKVEKAIADRKTAKDSLTYRIEKAKADTAEAEQLMLKATSTDDEKEYITAADKRRFNENIVEVCEKKLKDLDSEQEYNKILDAIRSDAKDCICEAEKKAAGLVAELYKLCDSIDDNIQKHNDLIVRWAIESGKLPHESLILFTSSNNELMYLKKILRRRIDSMNYEKTTSMYDGISIRTNK